MSINNKIPKRILNSLQKLGERRFQDIQRGVEKPGFLFPPVRHEIGAENLKGDPNKLGKITLAPFQPKTPSGAISVANYFLKRFQVFLLGGRPPQKRVRPQHARDSKLARTRNIKIKAENNEYTTHRLMDTLVFKETESIADDKQFAIADKRARNKHTQAKYHFSHPSK